MRVLEVLPSYSPHWGGPVAVLEAVAPRLVSKGIEVTLCVTRGHRVGNPVPPPSGVSLEVFDTDLGGRIWTAHSMEVARQLPRLVYQYDVIHIHELWHHLGSVAARCARRLRKPYVVSPHGALDHWALSHKGFRKRLYGAAIERPALEAAAAIHCLTADEARQLRLFGVRAPVRVIPNGTSEISVVPRPLARSRLEDRHTQLRGKVVLVFLGRLHPVKGLPLLVKALAAVSDKQDSLRLLIVGPDEGAKATAQRLVTELGLCHKVIFAGPVYESEKLDILSGADVFVLPSYSEGFSVAVLEAMSCGLPVIITPACHFPEVSENKAGIVVAPDVGELANAIGTLAGSATLREEMGKAGRDLVRSRFGWDTIADQWADLYSDVVANNGRGNRQKPPGWVS